MSFPIKSLFGLENVGFVDSVKTAAKAALRPLYQEPLPSQTAPTSLGMKLFQDLSVMWSSIQQESPSLSAHALRDFVLKNVQSTQLYSEGTNLAQTIIESFPSIQDMFGNDGNKDEDITETFGGFEDFSDVIKDLIKSMKVLVTFEVTSNIHEDLHIPHFIVQGPTQLKPRNPARRFIGMA